MRSRIVHLQPPSAPTQPTHTHLSHTAHGTISNCTCILSQEEHDPCFSMHLTQVTHSHLCTYTHTTHTHTCTLWRSCITSCRHTNILLEVVLQSRSTDFLFRLPSFLHLFFINILLRLDVDPFRLFFFSYPVPWGGWWGPRPCSAVSLMTVGEQSIKCTPPNIAQLPPFAVDWNTDSRG